MTDNRKAAARRPQRKRRNAKPQAGNADPAHPTAPMPAASPAEPSHALATIPLHVRWRDLDAFNHVNNSNFMTYLEEARIRWFDSLGEAWVTDATAPLLAAVQMNYKVPIPYPAKIVVELLADRIGTSSVTIGHRIVSDDGATLFADGHVVMVWIDRATGRPTALPDQVKAITGAL